MGYNTTVIVMNDALDQIEKDPEFGKKLKQAVCKISLPGRKRVDVSAGGHCNAATVLESHHADGIHLVALGGNTGYDLGYCGHWSDDDPVTLLKGLADKHGYRLVKKRSK